jgi:hypothetical protein
MASFRFDDLVVGENSSMSKCSSAKVSIQSIACVSRKFCSAVNLSNDGLLGEYLMPCLASFRLT